MLRGGAGNDAINGDAGSDVADFSEATGQVIFTLGAAGDGVVTATGMGTDTLSGIEGLVGGSGFDDLTGNDADNLLRGNAGDDSLSGGVGADTLDGGLGNDTLDGGNGSDTANYASATTLTSINLGTGARSRREASAPINWSASST